MAFGRWTVRVALVAVPAALIVLSLIGLHNDVLLCLPVLLLLLSLVAGCYVGEEGLNRLAAGPSQPSRRRRAPAPMVTTRRSSFRALPRGGQLIAASLAVRPPPAALTTA